MSTTALSDSRATWTYEPTLANAEVYLRRIEEAKDDMQSEIKQIDQERKMLRDQELQSLQMVHEERRKLVRTRQKPSKKRQTLFKQLATLDVEHTEIVRFVAEQSCRNFAEKFYTKLPAELREMVYGFLWTHNMLMGIRGDRAVYNVTTGLPLALSPARFKFGRRGMEEDCTPATLPCAGQPCDCFKWSDLPVGMRHQYVGTDVAKEVIAAYYRAIPSEQFSRQLDRLKDCLLMDHFHLGVIPADHIRKIELELNESDSMNTASYPPRPSGQVAIQSLRQNLEALRAVRSKSALKLKVCIICPRSQQFKNFLSLKIFRPIGMELRQAGAMVELVAISQLTPVRPGAMHFRNRLWEAEVPNLLDLDGPAEFWADVASLHSADEQEDNEEDDKEGETDDSVLADGSQGLALEDEDMVTGSSISGSETLSSDHLASLDLSENSASLPYSNADDTYAASQLDRHASTV